MSDLELARKQEIRYQLLTLLDCERPDQVPEALLLRGLKLSATLEDVRRELLYLKQRGLVEITGQQEKSAQLLAAGVDVVEGNGEVAGVPAPDGVLSRVEIERRREIRWRLLRVIDISRPTPLPESLAQRALHDVNIVFSQRDVRRVAAYLKQLKLIEIQEKPEWSFSLTADGVDLCDYSAATCPPGIARPEKYW